MPHAPRRNVLAAAAAACFAVWLGAGPTSCIARKMVGGGLDAAAGVFHWNRTFFWTLDPPPRADFLPEDEDLIRLARPAAKPAVHKPTATTTRRRILWLPPDDGPNRAESNLAGGTVATRRRRRAVENTVVSDRGLQGWLGIPGPPSGNQASGGQGSENVGSETTPTSLRWSKSLPERYQSDGMSANRRKKRNSHDIVEADAPQKWSYNVRGINSPTAAKSRGTQNDPSAASKMGRKSEKSVVHKEVQATHQSQDVRLARRFGSQLYNRLGYLVHDDFKIAENRHKKLNTASSTQSSKRTNKFIVISRKFKDEDKRLHKKNSGQRSLLWFQEGHDENRRTSFPHREASSSNSSSEPSVSSQISNILNQYANIVSPGNLYKEKERQSIKGYIKVLRRSISPGKFSSLELDPPVHHSGEDHQKLIKTLLAKISEEQWDITENTKRKLQDLPTLDGTVTSRTTRHTSPPSGTTNTFDSSHSTRKTGDSTILKQEEFTEMGENVNMPVDKSKSKQRTISTNSPRAERSLDGNFEEEQENRDVLVTPDDANQGTGKQRRIGRRLLGISPAEDVGAVKDGDGEMTQEEEAAVREQVVQDVVGDLLGVDGSGDGSGWGEIHS